MNIKFIENNLKVKTIIAFLIMFSYWFSQIFQGLNFLDSTFYLSQYENIFDNSEYISDGFPLYLTNIVGGLFIKIFSLPEIFGLRLLRLFNDLIIAFIVFLMLKKNSNRNFLLIGLLFVCFSYLQRPLEFYYDSFSTLLLIISIFFLHRGLVSEKNIFIFLSGFIVSLNIFARIPNVMDIGLIFIIPINMLYHKRDTKSIVYQILNFIVGILVGFIIIVAILKMSNQLNQYLNSLNSLLVESHKNGNESHGIRSLILANYNDYYGVLLWGLRWLSVSVILLISTKIRNKIIKYVLVTSCILLVVKFFLNNSYPSAYFIYFVSILVITFIITSSKTHANDKLISWLALFMLIVLPLGSNYPLINLGSYSIWIAAPFVINYILVLFSKKSALIIKVTSDKQYQIIINNRNYYWLFLCMIFLFMISLVYKNFTTTDFIGGFKKVECTATINSDKAKHIYVSDTLAYKLNKTLISVKPYVKSGSPIIVSDLPILICFLDCVPYNFTTFHWIDDVDLQLRLENTFQKTNTLPAFLMDKEDELFDTQKQITLNFLKKYSRVHKVWENSDYQLFVPESY